MAKTKQKTEVAQLHRIAGQLIGIEKLIENKSSVCEILQQIEAVRGNLKSLEKKIINNKASKLNDKDIKDCFDYLCKIS